MESPRYMELKKLSLDELAGVINLYPWFGAARKELCRRMAEKGGDKWGEAQFSDAAMYVVSRKMISDMMSASHRGKCTDKDVEAILKRYISDTSGPAAEPGGKMPDAVVSESAPRQARVVGGDYFSQTEYDTVRKDEDRVFSRFTSKTGREASPEEASLHSELEFCTETLAQIYAEQGYYEQARNIYRKLILAYPEKNAYFVALIEKLNPEN